MTHIIIYMWLFRMRKNVNDEKLVRKLTKSSYGQNFNEYVVNSVVKYLYGSVNTQPQEWDTGQEFAKERYNLLLILLLDHISVFLLYIIFHFIFFSYHFSISCEMLCHCRCRCRCHDVNLILKTNGGTNDNGCEMIRFGFEIKYLNLIAVCVLCVCECHYIANT